MTSAIGIWLLPVIQRIFKVHFSDLVDILVSIDIFAGVLLDEALTFYYRFPGIDKFYHFCATAQIALAGFLITRHFLLKHKTAKTIALSLVFAFFFAVAVEAMWEISTMLQSPSSIRPSTDTTTQSWIRCGISSPMSVEPSLVSSSAL